MDSKHQQTTGIAMIFVISDRRPSHEIKGASLNGV